MPGQVTVSAKIDRELRKKIAQLGIKPSAVIKRALENEVRERSSKKMLAEASKASVILKKVGEEEWTDAIRKGRDER